MKIAVHIEVDAATGSFEVTAPFNNLGMCYQLLELARDVCKAEADKLRQSNGVRPAHPAEVAELGFGKGTRSAVGPG